MAYINWSATAHIGRVMVISLVLPGVTNYIFSAASSESIDNIFEAKNPMIGIFTRTSKGVTRLYCTENNLKQTPPLTFISLDGEWGFVEKLKPFSGDDKTEISKNETILPGAMENLKEGSTIYTYNGIIKLKSNQNRPEIGLLVRPNTKPINRKGAKLFTVKFNNKSFDITFYNSHEGIHIICSDGLTHKELQHYYYYLGYDVEPDIKK